MYITSQVHLRNVWAHIAAHKGRFLDNDTITAKKSQKGGAHNVKRVTVHDTHTADTAPRRYNNRQHLTLIT